MILQFRSGDLPKRKGTTGMTIVTPGIYRWEIEKWLGMPTSIRGIDLLTGFTTDSREATAGMCFLAIHGENRDGNDYVASAIAAGAALAIAQYVPAGLEDRVIRVTDTVKALGVIAAAHKREIKPRTVGVTGSVGKTTAKEMICSVLSERFKTHKSAANHNNEIGLPMSMLSLDRSHEAAVYEMGMSARGEIAYLSQIARPDLAVITNIGSMHIEQLGSREAIRDAKLEILQGMPDGATIVLHGDEPLLQNVPHGYYVSMTNPDADMYVTNIITGENGTAFDIRIRGEMVESIVIPAFGDHNVYNAALAYAVGIHFGLDQFEIRRGLMNYKPGEMRQQIYPCKGVTVMEDCYNAGPESMCAALRVLHDLTVRDGGRAVAVLGDMKELGNFSEALHRGVGRMVAENGIKVLFTVGAEAERIAEEAKQQGVPIVESFLGDNSDYSSKKIAEALVCQLRPSDRVLFKGSRSMHLETIVEQMKELL